MAISQELRSRLVQVMRAYREEQGEEWAWDRTFEQIEDEACEVGDALAQALMAESLAEQATRGPRELWAVCPRCQQPAKAEPDVEPRLLDTRRGQVSWQEPKHYCPRCRQSFFPSVPRLGD